MKSINSIAQTRSFDASKLTAIANELENENKIVPINMGTVKLYIDDDSKLICSRYAEKYLPQTAK